MASETEEKHTPGPWAWGADDFSMASLTANGDMGKAGDMHGSHVLTVKLCKNCQKHVENSGEAADGWRFGRCATINAADARLIAAAPEMLAALKGIRAHLPDHPDTLWQAVDDAIAKASA